MDDDYDPNQFRSVESEEEEEEEEEAAGRCEKESSGAAASQESSQSPHQAPSLPSLLFHSTRRPADGDEAAEAFSDDSSDLSDSCDALEVCLLHEDSSLPERALQSRYQGFAERLDLSERSCGRMRDRKDCATTQHALDRRTRTILYTMMTQQLFNTINGCVSTGKEANVYHAVGESRSGSRLNLAVKVYTTSTTSFRDRSKYISGDFRMRHTAPHRHRSTYAMVKLWAEKEFRNLSRILHCGRICAPRPVRVKGVVLVMEWVGDEEGNAAPRLKEAQVEREEEWRDMYWEVVRQMRALFQVCGLVHGDLNEYNMLYHAGRPWIIDVSQSVMHDKNPNALLFLRKDVANVTAFFRHAGVLTLTVRELFHFIVAVAVGEPEEGDAGPDAVEAAHLQRARDLAEQRDEAWEWEEDGAFLEQHIPACLAEVERPARDIRAVRAGRSSAEQLPYAAMAGLQTEDFLSLKAKRRLERRREKEEGDERRDEQEEESEGRFVHPERPQKESPESRRRRKAEVKAAQREHRVAKKEERVKWEKKERAKQVRQPKFTRLL